MKWQVEDWSRTTSRPFEFFLDVGPVPQEKTSSLSRSTATAARSTASRRSSTREAGGSPCSSSPRSTGSAFRARTALVRAVAPAADSLASVTLDVDGRASRWKAPATSGARPRRPGSPAVLTARVKTALGRAAERSILLNGRGLQASLDAHVVEQMVAVVRAASPWRISGVRLHGARRPGRARSAKRGSCATEASRSASRSTRPRAFSTRKSSARRRAPVPRDARPSRHRVSPAVRGHRRACPRLDDVARGSRGRRPRARGGPGRRHRAPRGHRRRPLSASGRRRRARAAARHGRERVRRRRHGRARPRLRAPGRRPDLRPGAPVDGGDPAREAPQGRGRERSSRT